MRGLALTGLFALLGCGRDQYTVGEGPRCAKLEPAGASGTDEASLKLDLLFVVDSSPSMIEEQVNLARNFPALLSELAKLPSGMPDLHVAVITSDLGAGPTPIIGGCTVVGGDRGIFAVGAGCGLEPGARFVKYYQGGRQTNFQGSLENVFSCLSNVGTFGCGYEHTLQAARRALSGVNADNEGFLRAGAHLGLVFITDEDDCSAPADSDLFQQSIPGQDASFRCAAEGHLCRGQPVPATEFSAPLVECSASPDGDGKLIPVREMADFFLKLKKGSGGVSVSVIAGWPLPGQPIDYGVMRRYTGDVGLKPICSSGNGEADVSLRLKQFVDAFGGNGILSSICQDDLRSPMLESGTLITKSVGRCESP